MSELMKSVSGIRGIFGKGINTENTLRFAIKFGLFQKRRCSENVTIEKNNNVDQIDTQKIKILVGRDSRTTGESLSCSVIAGLLSVGVDVIWLGIIATPTLLLNVKELNAQGGICITASHNPANWNALKFIDSNGMFLFPEVMEEFLKYISSPSEHDLDNEKELFVEWDKIGIKYEDFNATWRHIQKILSIPYLDVDKVRKNKFKVVLDSVNGAGGVISPTLLRELGCEVIEINSEPTGYFAHNPEPLAKNLTQICEIVKNQKADIGFATDPDVDRLVIIDENGMCIGEEFTLLLAMKYVLKHKKTDIVTNLSSSMASEDIAEEFGVNVIRTKIGEINVSKAMLEKGSSIGGEGNGGIICPEVNYTRDAVTGMALILGYMAERELKISELVREIPRYFFAKEIINMDSKKIDIFFETILNYEDIFNDISISKNTQSNDKQRLIIDTTEGIKIISDKSWVHIRKSGTEPIVRIFSEAETEEEALNLCHIFKNKFDVVK